MLVKTKRKVKEKEKMIVTVKAGYNVTRGAVWLWGLQVDISQLLLEILKGRCRYYRRREGVPEFDH